MSDINLSGVQSSMTSVERAIQNMQVQLNENGRKMEQMSQELGCVSDEMRQLREEFVEYMQEAAKSATLQKAATELVRVRQELEHNFGGYKVVRNTMLGVLQATDLALVKKTTISQVTEELMLSTPDYWLAPCLVAVSAWIGNDRDLANRAITEAIKRDEEKTALTMALICRRNNRTAACYEWLSLYFSKQSANNFTESNFAYLNAYLNGVFGPDENHMCDDYVAKWMKEIRENGSDIENRQVEQWREYCNGFTVDMDSQFPKLKGCVREYGDISAYVSRIDSVDAIRENFHSMKSVDVDQQKLKRNIDDTLVDLISRYDSKELPLRKEERYLKAIRQFDGDVDTAKRLILQEDEARKEDTIDLISQMTNIIVKKDDALPSEKKTSVSFLGSYIRSGFQDYITEKKEAFPQNITLEIDGWTGSTAGNSGAEMLKVEFEKAMDEKRILELANLPVKRPKIMMISSIVVAVLALVLFFKSWFLGLVGLAAAAGLFIYSRTFIGTLKKREAEIKQSYAAKVENGKQMIDDTMDEWNTARSKVLRFESGSIPDVVA